MEDLTSHPQDVRGADCAANTLSDDALLRQFADGEAGAARILTDRLGPRCYSVALRMLGNRAEAEDVTQDAMMRLWQMAPNWVSGQAKVSTWLYRVTLNLCVDIRRKKTPDRLSDVPEPEDGKASVVDRMQDEARKDALQSALAELPERQRQAVVLRHIEELPNPEIAGIMGISVEAVESLTARGKRSLTAILAGRREELGYDNGG
ncbi:MULTISPECIES: RNA polymerase sigma factor [Ruegeria]|jgi:RNA polymerase sigma-70 factor (ECF subfamily)|uniref:RNA polymerase sigma factor n=1 Tax=Ruegeria TaxID=97050 RepID=UPI0012691899|nr:MULTISPECIES: RNA polymerase sigma factor [Ruegeria]MCA0905178.1 RNA polymerase sigma factor [Ruegeria marisrubri]NOC44164.1 RNA polymerase sigma factor [Ruegeria sp. HKCCD7559]QFT73536.1 ECF RNA polymerase sigma factor SigW [Ruegeria sp. THAF33]